MTTKKYFFFIFFLVFAISTLVYLVVDKKNKKGNNLKFLSKKIFHSNLKNPLSWMQDQIEKDFQEVDNIPSQIVDNTMKSIKRNAVFGKDAFYRYRIINNKLYRYHFEKEKIAINDLDFERAVKTLLKLTKIADIDFIYTDVDGLPLDLVPKSVYQNVDRSAPILCHAKLKDEKNLILIPDHNSYAKSWKTLTEKIISENQKVSWEQKKEKAFWRGGSNDQQYTLDNYQKKPRFIISKLSRSYFDIIDAGITPSWGFQLEHILKKEDVLKDFATTLEHLEYKYLPIIDGHMCAYPGYQWRLLSNSICFKQESNQIQWFYGALHPYEHYIPIKNDISDLIDKINWAKKNDSICLKITKNATSFAKNNLMLENVYVYLYKVLEKYSKYQSLNRRNLLNDLKNDNRWVCIENRKKTIKILNKRKQN